MVVCLSSCSQQKSSSWNPDIGKLYALAQFDDPDLIDFVETVKRYYDSLRDKDWESTYAYRTSSFRNDVSRSFYKQTMQRREDRWALLHYEVMSVDVFVNPYGEKQARLVIRIVQAPLSHENIAVVWWKREESGWRAEESGADLLPLSRRFSTPMDEEEQLKHLWSDQGEGIKKEGVRIISPQGVDNEAATGSFGINGKEPLNQKSEPDAVDGPEGEK